jgi:hypothetical protein
VQTVYSVVAFGLILANFTGYPAYGDRGAVMPRRIEALPRVEATTDRGPIVEIIVRCASGTAIISYSKVERLYCSPKLKCDGSIAVTISRTCG